jgi:hypothetical protein
MVYRETNPSYRRRGGTISKHVNVLERTKIWSCVPTGPETKTDCVACLVNCSWSSPAQLFLVPSPAGLMTIFYCLATLTVLARPSSNSPDRPSNNYFCSQGNVVKINCKIGDSICNIFAVIFNILSLF